MDDDKYRHELKYLISNAETQMIKQRLSGLISVDPHAGENGIYNIRSAYFDDYYNRCFFENENGTDPREKFRIRIYNHSDSKISLECKRKERGKTLKSSCALSVEQTELLLQGKIPKDRNSSLLNKLALEMELHQMKPAVIVEYDRMPFIYKYGNVRITLDTNICSSMYYDGFLNGAIPKRPVMPAGTQLLEVKFDEYLPDFIYHALQLENLQQIAFSKYYLCRKYFLR